MFNITYYGFHALALLTHCVAALLLVWLIIKFLPRVLKAVSLQAAVDENTLRWLNTALIGFTLLFAIIQPFIVFLTSQYPW
ncbi:MAG TPA: hypothetical protein VNG90_03425 [Candidatus Acidoferrum sp.]|nr:hypothetical protein [Candidatus Acidoferrum sp.]